jgi:hypothetical protein
MSLGEFAATKMFGFPAEEIIKLVTGETPAYTPTQKKILDFAGWAGILAPSAALPPAIVGWRAAATLPTAERIAARTALAPLVGAEKVTGLALKYGLEVPIRTTVKGATRVGENALNVALDTGLDKWIAAQGRKGEAANVLFRKFLTPENKIKVTEFATNHYVKRVAQNRGEAWAARQAAKDTLKDIEPLLLKAGEEVAVKPSVPEVPAEVPTPTAVIPKAPVIERPAVKPVPEVMPEAGLQKAAFGVETKEVRPIGKGKVVQEKMDDLLKLEQQKLAAVEAEVAKANAITPEQRREFEGELAGLKEKFGMTADEIGDRIMAIRQAKTRIKSLEADLATKEVIAEPAAPKEIKPSPTLSQELDAMYAQVGNEVKAFKISLKGMRGEEAKIGRATLGMMEKQLEHIQAQVKTIADLEKIKPAVKRLRKQIHAVAAFKGFPKSQLAKIYKDTTGKSGLTSMNQPELEAVLAKVRVARPVKIKSKTVIKPATENDIQSLKDNMIALGQLDEGTYQSVKGTLGLTTDRYENVYKFITEKEGKALIRKMNDEAEIGLIADRIAEEKALAANPALKAADDELTGYIAKSKENYYHQGTLRQRIKSMFLAKGLSSKQANIKADVSIWEDQRFIMDKLEVRTGKPFYNVWKRAYRQHRINQTMDARDYRRIAGSTPEFQKILNSKKSLDRVNDYIAAKNKWLDVKSPKDITSEEIKLANVLEEMLFEAQPSYRFNRFKYFYQLHEGNAKKIVSEEGIPDAPIEDVKEAIKIYESQGASALRRYLDTKTWGVVGSGFEPHYVVNPRLAMKRLRTAFATGRFKARSGVEFYPADMDVVARVGRYLQQMRGYSMRPYIRKMEELYQESIPQLANPEKIRRGLSLSANEMMGYIERGGFMYDAIIRVASQAYITIFGTLPILPFRNLFQNAAWYTDKSYLVKGLKTKLTENDVIVYETYVSQMAAVAREQMLAGERGLPPFGRLNRLITRLNMYGASDSKINRVISFKAGLTQAEDGLTAFKKTGDAKEFIAKSGAAEFTLTQQRDIIRQLGRETIKDYHPDIPTASGEQVAKWEVGLELTNNVHFIYDRAGRAWAEMGAFGRVFGSLLVFARSLTQRYLKQVNSLVGLDYPRVKRTRALKVLLSMIIGGATSGYIYQKITGRKRNPYNPLSVLIWEPGGIPIGVTQDLAAVWGDVLMAVQGDEDAKRRLPVKMTRVGDAMVPFYQLIINNIEASINKKDIDRLAAREVISVLEQEMQKQGLLDKAYKPNKEFYEADRRWWERLQHAIAGSEPVADPIKKAITDLAESEKQLGQRILAEDSDDSYIYEIGDLAADIRKLTRNVKAEDITEANGFSSLTLFYKEAEGMWEGYYYNLPSSQRMQFRESPEGAYIEAYLFFWGKLSVLRNPNSEEIVRRWIDKYNIPKKAVPNLVDLEQKRAEEEKLKGAERERLEFLGQQGGKWTPPPK